jgi:hypothetical protein
MNGLKPIYKRKLAGLMEAAFSIVCDDTETKTVGDIAFCTSNWVKGKKKMKKMQAKGDRRS